MLAASYAPLVSSKQVAEESTQRVIGNIRVIGPGCPYIKHGQPQSVSINNRTWAEAQ